MVINKQSVGPINNIQKGCKAPFFGSQFILL